MLNICKKPGIKNCVRITTEEDIPGFLKDVVRVEGDTLVLNCLEGEERVPAGSVIAFEELSEEIMNAKNRKSKMNVWHKANAKETLIEIDNVFYEKPQPVKAFLLDESLPEELVEELGDNFIYRNGEYHLKTNWGVSTAATKNGYLVVYGLDKDGKLDANILTVGTPSFAQYYVLTEDGKIGEPLEEHHRKTVNTRKA